MTLSTFTRSLAFSLLAAAGLSTSAAHCQLVVANGVVTIAGTYSGAGLSSGGFSGDGGPAASAMLNTPAGVAVDAAGNIYIADSRNFRVRKISLAGIISTFAGNGTPSTGGGVGDGGPATSAEFARPSDVALDSAGNLYICDANDGRIRLVNAATGIITTIAGGGAGSATAAGVPATSVRLQDPESLAFDSSGNLYFSDALAQQVYEVAHGTGILTIVAGNGMEGYSGDGGAPTSAELYDPSGLALDAAGHLYIADAGNSVVREIIGGKIVTFAGTGPQHAGDSGDGGLATLASLAAPSRLVFDSSNNLYISDSNVGVIREVITATGIIQTFAGKPGGSAADGIAAADASFSGTSEIALAFDHSGNLLVTADNRLRRIGPLSPPAAANIGSSSTANLIFMTTTAETISGFSIPAAIGGVVEYAAASATGSDCAIDGKTVLPAHTNCTVAITFKPAYPGPRPVAIQVLTSAGNVPLSLKSIGIGPLATFTPGTLSSIAGTFGVQRGITSFMDNPGGDGGPATSATFNSVYEIAVDGAGDVYVADVGANDVRKINILTGVITNFAGDGNELGGYSGDGGPATQAEFQTPYGVAVDSAGNVYISDQGNNVVRKVAAATGIITTVAGNGNRGDTGDGGPATSATLYYPRGLAVDSNDNLYISDFPDSVIRKLTVSTGIITTVAGNASLSSVGSGGYSGDGGPATSAQLYAPADIALDASNNLYIADLYNRVVRKVTAATGIITTFAGTGSSVSGNGGDGGPATSAQFNGPYGIAADVAGNIYISDEGTNTIRKVNAVTGIISTIAGTQHGGYNPPSPDGTTATAATLNTIIGITLSPDGALLLADDGNVVVRRISVTGAPLVYPTVTRVGVADSKDDPQTTTLSNIGNAPLQIPPPSMGTNPYLSPAWTIENSATCPQLSATSSTFSLTSGASCTYPVDFRPTVAGANTGSLVFTSTFLSAATTQTILLTGNATPGLSLSPTTLTFPAVAVGTTGASMSATLTNSGTTYITLTKGALTDATDFTQTDNCSGTLGPQSTCTIVITFTPKTAGTLTSTYSIADQASNAAPLTIAITAANQPATLTVNPNPVAFPATAINTTSTAITVTLTNSGTGTLQLHSPLGTLGGADSASFTYGGTTCVATLSAGSTCTFSLTFTPSAARAFSANFTIASSDPNSPTVIPLTGTGIAGNATAVFNYTTASFGSSTVSTQTAPQTFTLTNNGSGTLTIAGVALGGANATSFVITGNGCNSTLAANTSCNISVAFDPTTTGPLSGTLTVTDNAGGTAGSTQTVSFTGTGIAGSASFNPTSGTFAATTTGAQTASQSFTLTNAGPGIVTIGSTALGGANASSFVITTNTCAAAKQLASGASCAISVAFNPTAIGPLAATLLITDDSGGVAGSMQTVTLTGTGTAPTATLTPVSTALGTVGVGLQTTTILTLTNTSNGVLPAGSAQFTGTNGTTAPAIGNCSVALAAGASCSFSVIANPIQAGAFSGTATFVNSAGTQTATVSGTAAGPVLTPSPTFDFGGVALTTTTTQVFTLKNIEVSTVILNSIKVTGTGFAQQSSTCGTTLAPNATCTITVAFGPTTAGATTGTLAVSDSSGTNPSVTLTGTGVMGSATLTPAMYGFGAVTIGSPVTTIFTLANTGTTALAIKAVMFANQAGFVNFTATNNCGSSLAFSASCSISVTATATAAGGGSAVLVVQDSGGGHSAALSATGTLPNAVLTPGAATFPSTVIGSTNSQTFTLTNNGTSSITVTSASLSPGSGTTSAFKVSSNNCTTLIAAASCSIVVVYTPTAATTDTATLLVFDTAGTQTAALTGTGLAPSDFALRLDTLDGPTLIDPSSGKSVFGLFTDVNTSQPFHGTILLSASSTDLSPQSTYTFSPATGPFSTPAQFDGPNEGFLTVFDSTFRLYQANQTPMYRRIHSGGSAPLVILAGVFFVFFLRRRSLRFRPLLTLALVAGLLPLALTSTGCAWFAGPGYAICGSGLQTSYCSAKVTITGTNGSIVHSITGTLYY